jgi:hypothetical protein
VNLRVKEEFMQPIRPSRTPLFTGLLLILMGLALAAAGVWLVVSGGSWYYIAAGFGFLLTGGLLLRPALRPMRSRLRNVTLTGTPATDSAIRHLTRLRQPTCPP